MTGNINRVKDIEAGLSSFSHLGVNQLKDKILHLSSDILTSKTCSQLLSICPNQEEINLFKSYKGPLPELNKVMFWDIFPHSNSSERLISICIP